MSKRGWTWRIVVRYTLIQAIAFVVFVAILLLIRKAVHFPLWVGMILVIAWIIKDVAFFPFTWSAYDWDYSTTLHPMIGAVGKTTRPLSPSGYISVRGELWRAELTDSHSFVEKDHPVVVRKVEGLTLIVEPSDMMSDI